MAAGLAAAPVTPQGREVWRRRGIEHAARFHWENAARAVMETYSAAADKYARPRTARALLNNFAQR
jgi:hypothetical protein